jgi:hypothetical protein
MKFLLLHFFFSTALYALAVNFSLCGENRLGTLPIRNGWEMIYLLLRLKMIRIDFNLSHAISIVTAQVR